jgi:hypothetical protein
MEAAELRSENGLPEDAYRGGVCFPGNISCRAMVTIPSLRNHDVILGGLFHGNPRRGSLDSISERGRPLLEGLTLSNPLLSCGRGGGELSSVTSGWGSQPRTFRPGAELGAWCRVVHAGPSQALAFHSLRRSRAPEPLGPVDEGLAFFLLLPGKDNKPRSVSKQVDM